VGVASGLCAGPGAPIDAIQPSLVLDKCRRCFVGAVESPYGQGGRARQTDRKGAGRAWRARIEHNRAIQRARRAPDPERPGLALPAGTSGSLGSRPAPPGAGGGHSRRRAGGGYGFS